MKRGPKTGKPCGSTPILGFGVSVMVSPRRVLGTSERAGVKGVNILTQLFYQIEYFFDTPHSFS